MRDNYTPEYTRYLPHFHRPGATFFVTFRLFDSLPKEFMEQLSKKYHDQKEAIVQANPLDKEKQLYLLQRAYFLEFDQALDKCEHGPTWLKEPQCALPLADQLNKFDGEFYKLIGYTIMPNHAHAILDFSIQLKPDGSVDTATYKNLDYVMDRVKGASARYANLALDRTGQTFWQAGYYERYVRDQKHLVSAVNYLKQNVVAAKICTHWMQHPFTWVREGW
jgi:REP element-mobilizing transposase RayT